MLHRCRLAEGGMARYQHPNPPPNWVFQPAKNHVILGRKETLDGDWVEDFAHLVQLTTDSRSVATQLVSEGRGTAVPTFLFPRGNRTKGLKSYEMPWKDIPEIIKADGDETGSFIVGDFRYSGIPIES